MRIVFIPKLDFQLTIIKEQLASLGRKDIFVFLKKEYKEEHGDIVEYDVEPDKKNALILDYAGNLERFGAVDQIGIRRVIKNVGEEEVDELVTGRLYTKFCPSCGEMCGMFLKNCPSCSFTFAMETMGIKASESSVMGGDEEEVIFDVLETTFSRHKKAGKPDSFRIDYNIGTAEKISEYLLFEHNAWGRKKAQARWKRQCFEEFGLDEAPETVGDAFGRATMGELKGVSKIKAKKENGFWRVLAWKWDENQVLESPDLFVPMSDMEELLDEIGL